MEKLFHLKENHTDVKTEVMAGITTFMTMAYILAVNPNILSAAGMDAKAVLIATSLAAFAAPCSWRSWQTTPLHWHPAWA